MLFRFLQFLIIFLCPLQAYSTPPSMDSAIDISKPSASLSALLNHIHTLQGKFIQIQIDSQHHIIFSGEGRFFLKKPNYFRWETLKPVEQLILADSKKLWIYDADLKQVTTYPQTKGMGETPAALLSGSFVDLEKTYQMYSLESFSALPSVCKKESNTNSFQGFCLIPKNEDHSLKGIMIYFKNDQLKQMELIDKLNQNTEVVFNQMKINLTVSTNLFKFQKPAGVEVIEGEM